jgi:hypothetical protein
MFNVYMHTYKSIYTWTYMLCTNRFVVIFVVIVWKTTLNTRKKLKRDYLRRLFKKIIWERSFERNHLRKTMWRESFERNNLRKKEEDEREIFDKRRRNEILRQTTRLLRISINKTCLFIHVWYLSPLNILFRPLLSNISLPPLSLSLKLSSLNDLSQIISFKWSPRTIFANNLF